MSSKSVSWGGKRKGAGRKKKVFLLKLGDIVQLSSFSFDESPVIVNVTITEVFARGVTVWNNDIGYASFTKISD